MWAANLEISAGEEEGEASRTPVSHTALAIIVTTGSGDAPLGERVTGKLSSRLAAIVDALPLYPGIRVLEIGCGPGAAARAVADRIGDGYVLAIDRSAKAIEQAVAGSAKEIASGRLGFRRVAIEDYGLDDSETPFDLAFAVRVGALDGRHPHLEGLALRRVAAALNPDGRLFLDGGSPLKEVSLEAYRKR